MARFLKSRSLTAWTATSPLAGRLFSVNSSFARSSMACPRGWRCATDGQMVAASTSTRARRSMRGKESVRATDVLVKSAHATSDADAAILSAREKWDIDGLIDLRYLRANISHSDYFDRRAPTCVCPEATPTLCAS